MYRIYAVLPLLAVAFLFSLLADGLPKFLQANKELNNASSVLRLSDTYQQTPELYDMLKTRDVAAKCEGGTIHYKVSFRVVSEVPSKKLGFIPLEVNTAQTCTVGEEFDPLKSLPALGAANATLAQPQYDKIVAAVKTTQPKTTAATSNSVPSMTNARSKIQIEEEQPKVVPNVKVISMMTHEPPKVIVLEENISGQ
jgi:hypothetical protein